MNEGSKQQHNLFSPSQEPPLPLLTLLHSTEHARFHQLSFVPIPHILTILAQAAWENPDACHKPWAASAYQFQASP